MPWAAGSISSADVVAIHAGLVPTSSGDGEIITIGGDDHDSAAARATQFDHSRTFNCRNPNQSSRSATTMRATPSRLSSLAHLTSTPSRSENAASSSWCARRGCTASPSLSRSQPRDGGDRCRS